MVDVTVTFFYQPFLPSEVSKRADITPHLTPEHALGYVVRGRCKSAVSRLPVLRSGYGQRRPIAKEIAIRFIPGAMNLTSTTFYGCTPRFAGRQFLTWP